jgi:hypothetical protein
MAAPTSFTFSGVVSGSDRPAALAASVISPASAPSPHTASGVTNLVTGQVVGQGSLRTEQGGLFNVRTASPAVVQSLRRSLFGDCTDGQSLSVAPAVSVTLSATSGVTRTPSAASGSQTLEMAGSMGSVPLVSTPAPVHVVSEARYVCPTQPDVAPVADLPNPVLSLVRG